MTTTTGSTNASSAVIAREGTSRDWLRLISKALAVIGLLISGYLFWAEATNNATVCPATGAFNCDLVQHSIYSKVGPIPVVYLGLAGYLAILAVLLLQSRLALFSERGVILVFLMAAGGFLFSLYLTAMEAFVLHAWCVWCVGSALTMTALFIVSFVRLWQSISAPAEDDYEAA